MSSCHGQFAESHVNIWRKWRKLGRKCSFRKIIQDIRHKKTPMLISDVRLSQRGVGRSRRRVWYDEW